MIYICWERSFKNFSFSIISSKEIPGLISFRMDWLDLLAVQYSLFNLHPLVDTWIVSRLGLLWLKQLRTFIYRFLNIYLFIYVFWLVAKMAKNPPAMWETWVRCLGQEDPLEKGMVTHSSILAWRITWTEEPGRLQSIGLQRVEHDWMNNTHMSGSIE